MRIIKRPKFKRCTCSRCGCVFKPGPKDIGSLVLGEIFTRCPFCNKDVPLVFKNKQTEEVMP